MNPNRKKITVAVDGYSSCGKSTFAKSIARKLGYLYIDSGAMYRAVTLWCMENNLFSGNDLNLAELKKFLPNIQISFRQNEEESSNEIFLNGRNVEKEIRSIQVAEKVSFVSKIKEVRERLVDIQRELGKDKGIVMDGRDIGTVVFPQAEMKIFMTASPEIRAQRRYKELIEKGMQVNFQEVLTNLVQRDEIDSTRAESPLRKANDALVLDNSHLSPDDQMLWFEKEFAKILLRH